MTRTTILQLIVVTVLFATSILVLGTWHGVAVEPDETRLAPPPGGFVQVKVLYDDHGEWHIKHLGAEE